MENIRKKTLLFSALHDSLPKGGDQKKDHTTQREERGEENKSGLEKELARTLVPKEWLRLVLALPQDS